MHIISAFVSRWGTKPALSDGMAFGSDGSLFFGGLNTDSIYQLRNPALANNKHTETPTIIAKEETLWWPDTFAFDNVGGLWVTSNRLESFLFPPYGMDFTGRHGANFHIIKIHVGTNSYIKGEQRYDILV